MPTPKQTTQVDQPSQAPRRSYIPAVGPRLRLALWIVFVLTALLAANAAYLFAIKALSWITGAQWESFFYLVMFAAHIVLGLLLIVPLVLFGFLHMFKARSRPNRRAVRVGYGLLVVSMGVLVSGVLLTRFLYDLKNPIARETVYWTHVGLPLAAGWLYWLHRLAGPRIKWRIGFRYAAVVVALCGVMIALHSADPRVWRNEQQFDERFLLPSLTQTATGKPIPAKALMMDQYCLKCHADVHARWSDSVHRFASFNNPAYLASVRETRKFSMERDGNVKRSRFCAGCHDPVPLLSGAFDDPKFDDVNHPTAHAGITCTVCHAITRVNSPKGNADYTIEEPIHYPFASSDSPILQWVNQQLIKAKPSFHKKTFLKPLHKTAEFCSTCHKVNLPKELNDYKWLRGQNHYDSFLLSGVSGVSARSFYYPPKAQENCNRCHMPLRRSDDFAARHFDNADALSVHDHLFPSANTAIAHLRGRHDVVAEHQAFLQDIVHVDLFGIREGDAVDGKLHAPLRPSVPALAPGKQYVLETVVRTLKLGHLFTQGTADSNEIWLDITVKSGDRVVGRSGGMDENGEVDPWSHFVNAFVIDRHGNRIDRRNAEDIFVALYNHQIPPGAAATVHYGFTVPDELTQPLTVEIKLQYRKFDRKYMAFVKGKTDEQPDGKPYQNTLPITTLATDIITFPVVGLTQSQIPIGDIDDSAKRPPAWQRWNDYGIGLFLKGSAQLRQAREAFEQVEQLGVYHGPLNLARVHYRQGDLVAAAAAINKAAMFTKDGAPTWTLNWLSGLVNRQQGRLDEAADNFQSILNMRTQDMLDRGFDFSRDYVVINELGTTLFQLARKTSGNADRAEREALLQRARDQFIRTLAIDPENATAHFNLKQLYTQLSLPEDAARHGELHLKYKADDNARDGAVSAARAKYPAANHAIEPSAIYQLQRKGNFGLKSIHAPSPSSKEKGNP